MRWRRGTAGANGLRPDGAGGDEGPVLAVIDEALRSGAAGAEDPDERRLQELALALRADSPRPDPGFERRLESEVRADFARPAHGPTRRLSRRLQMSGPSGGRGSHGLLRARGAVVAGAAASMLLALVVAASVLAPGGGDLGGGEDSEQPVIAPAEPDGAAPGPGAPEDLLGGSTREVAPSGGGRLEPPATAGDPLPGRDNRRVERSAQMTLMAPGDELQEVAAGVAEVADRHDGVLMSSNVTSGTGGGGGSFELRVPVDELPSTIADLSDLAQVESLTQAADDRTAGFVARGAERDAANAELEGLREELAAADTAEKASAIRTEIRSTRADLRAAERAVQKIGERTSFASVSVALEEGEPDSGELGGALDDGLQTLEDVLAGAVRALGVLIPLALLAGLVWWAGARLRRRRRESVLA